MSVSVDSGPAYRDTAAPDKDSEGSRFEDIGVSSS